MRTVMRNLSRGSAVELNGLNLETGIQNIFIFALRVVRRGITFYCSRILMAENIFLRDRKVAFLLTTFERSLRARTRGI